METANATIELIAVIASIAGLLGWVIHTIVKHFIAKDKDSMIWIQKLVQSNKENTDSFVNTINHQRTMDREMQSNQTVAIVDLTHEIERSNEVNEKMLQLLNRNNA